jgi:hypothetical protein
MEKKLNKTGKKLELIVAVLFIGIGVALRLLPHPPNFAPIAAIALFGGVYFSKKLALALPLVAMVASDIFIGVYDIKLMLFVYGSFILCTLVGFWLKNNKKWHTVLGASVFGSILFFIITNFAVWTFASWYAKDFSGLIQCYIMALPFFKNTLLGDVFYAVIFFGGYEFADIWIRKKFSAKEQAAALV